MHANKRRADQPEAPPRPSKTQLKQAMHDLQALGEELVQLSRDQLKRMQLDADLLDALLEYQRIPKFEAQRRQLQYIGKLMRGLEPEPIRAALALVRGESASEIARLHRLEKLRSRFLEDENVLQEIAAAHPLADLTRLRQLRRATLKEQAEHKPPKNFRELFQVFKELESQESLATAGGDNV